ncbi:MAG: polyribonucleotide nucleotidyltransferase [Actinobacteria bacterium]|nr:polyribonucleotide nucleotidyltransferase [Actinomycetota bacterium]
MSEVFLKEFEFYGKSISFEFGRVAKQANAACLVRCEDTVVLVTATASKTPREGIDFFPLIVDVEEKMYAAGKIPGSFFKREGKPSDKAILIARLIDRPLRPCFPEGFRNDVQIVASPLSVDQINPFDVLALNGASAALHVSDIPFNGPVGAVRIGLINGSFVVNPTFQELEQSDLDLVVAGSREGILMVEAGSKEVPEEKILEALEFAQKPILELIEIQEEIASKIGKEKMEVVLDEIDSEIENRVIELTKEKILEAIRKTEKAEREEALNLIEEEMLSIVEPEVKKTGKEVVDASGNLIGYVFEPEQEKIRQAKLAYKKLIKKLMREMILNEGIRADGRKPDEIRPISIDVGILPRTHGSGLFTRGQTQVLTVCTLGTTSEEQIIDGLDVEESKRYMHHYNFPPFSTGEVSPLRGPRRREIGHGALAERALVPVIPDEKEFPYTIRLVSEVLESNGSTSMASVCGSTLALMDAGVPIKAPVAGIAMGLISEGDNYEVLTDILGMEDALGDMDFKVAGTQKGVTALQLDNKIGGLKMEVLKDALERARKARLFILSKMLEVIPEPRKELSPFAPRVITLKVDSSKIRDIIGPGGKTIHSIIDETGVQIDIQQDGTVYIFAKDELGGEKAKEIIENITKDVKVGEQYVGRVTRIASFGAFVEISPGKEGLIHISKIAPRRIENVEDVFKVGDRVLVEVTEIDALGRINLATVEYTEAMRKRGQTKG